MLDLIVTGGVAVMPGATEPADIGVAGGRIAAIGAPGSLAAAGTARTVDASGQIVIPGGVDPHIHCSFPIVFPGRNEELLSAPPEQVSRAALHGGTTTLLDFALCPSDQPLQQSIEARQREWAGACCCDYGFHLLLRGKLSQGVLGALPEAIQAGHASVKIFTTDIRPPNAGRMVQFGDIWEVLKILGAAGGIAAIHAEDNDIVMHMYEKLIREDRTGFENMAEVHNTLVRGSVVQPGDPAGRECRGGGTLHGARLGRFRGGGDRGVAGAGLSDLRRDPAPIPALHRRGLQAAGRADVPHLPLAQIRRATRRRCGRRPATARSRRSPPTRCAARSRSSCRAAGSTTPPAAIPGSSRDCR